MKKTLSNIDIVSVNCVDPVQSLNAIRYCQRMFNFNRSILFSSDDLRDENVECKKIDKLTWHQYNDFVLSIGKYSDADYILLIQDDGHIVNADMWSDEFLDYDYIGAPWPNENDWINLQTISSEIREVFEKNRVGNGGFSLRSRKFLNYSNTFSTCGGIGEDSFLCTRKYDEAIKHGIKFAPFEVACRFSYENPCIELGTPWKSQIKFDPTRHFGWHGKNFTNTYQMMNLKNT